MGFFDRYRAKKQAAEKASALYVKVVEQSRLPRFYIDHGVPDSVDGRFDMIIVHVMLLIRRLRGHGKDASDLSQEVLNLLFGDMDRNFREMGIGDMSIGKHVKKVAKAFYGRAEVIEEGLDKGAEDLASGLLETLYRSVENAEKNAADVAAYVIATDQHLAGQPLERILAGEVQFSAAVQH